jgi:heme/copper-type cytochrome/quinol oxidase subunit 2
MLEYLILGIFLIVAIVGVYFAFKHKGKNTPNTSCDDEPIDYLLK